MTQLARDATIDAAINAAKVRISELERQLRAEYRRWDHLQGFEEFRDDTLSRAWEAREQFRGATGGEF